MDVYLKQFLVQDGSGVGREGTDMEEVKCQELELALYIPPHSNSRES